VIARYKPYYFKPVAGKTYLWCSCGRSARQPFCDGSHKGTGFEPVRYTAPVGQEEVLFCGCKRSKDQPFCDGSHNNLREVYEEEDPDSKGNRCIPLQAHHRDGRYCLNGNTFVAKVARLATFTEGNIRWRAVITAAQGARHQSMFHVEIDKGLSPVFEFGERDVALLATAGSGELEIGVRRLELTPAAGMYVRPGETFRIHSAGDEPVSLYLAVSPQIDAPVFAPAMTDRFDRSCPQRAVKRDPSKAERMADRTFQLLVGPEIGSHNVTQFIGTIPLSMAARHRHLYEETLVILSGRGAMWTEDMKAPVSPGDVIFLPSKQIHSLQCTDEAGMVVAGVIHPGGNPNINF
jgi:CDGSH-type Zn-finger protein/mannose-6-phosphate isomerase-like protein (cupin superfamily)